MQTTEQNQPSKLSSLNRKTEKEAKHLLKITNELMSFEPGWLFGDKLIPKVDSKIVDEMIWDLHIIFNDINTMNDQLGELLTQK